MVPSPLEAPTMHLVFKPCPETSHTYFNYVLKLFLQTCNDPYVCALAFAKMAEIACKTRHFVSAKQFYVYAPNG